ncbi:dihydrofolate reductase family protein [Breoghania sp.]|uniref:dihydrofolate reductase family protein n=1 Tax=Breoghania sp. TaxID=2065378 RepID=UPI002AA8831B|nr:dihydrofolate reductase family protein [Breoghania sp.]
MISTLDGRLQHERWTDLPEGALDLYEEVAERLDAEGWIVGRETMEVYLSAGPANLADASAGHADHIGDRAGRPLGICFDRLGKLLPESDEVEGSHLVLGLSDRVSAAHVDALAAKGISIFFTGSDGEDVAGALERIGEAFGVDALLLEGGGIINGVFLEHGLIDETSTLVVPVLDGQSDIPCIYNHQGALAAHPLTLLDVQKLEHGVVWMRHEVVRP